MRTVAITSVGQIRPWIYRKIPAITCWLGLNNNNIGIWDSSPKVYENKYLKITEKLVKYCNNIGQRYRWTQFVSHIILFNYNLIFARPSFIFVGIMLALPNKIPCHCHCTWKRVHPSMLSSDELIVTEHYLLDTLIYDWLYDDG
jgi:hypothetical protein